MSARNNNSESGSTVGSRSPRNKRTNKIYRTPPTPPPEILLEKEKTFVIDSNACSSVSRDYSKTNPKLGPVIKPYNAQKDRHVKQYFTFHGVKDTLEKTEQNAPGSSIAGPIADRFETVGAGHVYLALRNQNGAGHSHESIDGHSQFMKGIKPTIGYHGPYGFRRNTPWLRAMPSPFGTASRSPTH